MSEQNRAGRGRRQAKADRSRRAWSEKEEKFLLGVMKELVATGWKTDNGFRMGCLMKAEESMRQEFPGTDLKANPHIQSRIHTWKKHFYALSRVLDRSGVGFNVHNDHKIDVDDEHWSQIVKADGSARPLSTKSWPYYEDWKIIFGKDRATGMMAEDIVDAHDDLDLIEKMASNGTRGEYDFGLDDVVGTDASLDGVSPTTLTDSGFSAAPESTPTATTSKKRKQRDALEGLVEVIEKMHEATNTRLEYLATRIGYEFDLAKARKDVFELVGSINGLNLTQVFDASEFILTKVERMDSFISLSHAAKHAYVYRALEKYSGQ